MRFGILWYAYTKIPNFVFLILKMFRGRTPRPPSLLVRGEGGIPYLPNYSEAPLEIQLQFNIYILAPHPHLIPIPTRFSLWPWSAVIVTMASVEDVVPDAAVSVVLVRLWIIERQDTNYRKKFQLCKN